MTESDPRRLPASARARVVCAAARALAIVGAWVTALGVAIAAFPVGSRNGMYEAISFGLAFAIASALAGVVALAVGGRRSLAVEAAVAIIGTVLLAAGLAAGMLWLAPVEIERVLGLGSQELLFRRRQLVADAGRLLGRTRFTAEVVLGPVVGAVAGLLVRLGRRRPGLAAGVAVGLLVAVGASADLAGRLVADAVLESRLEGGKWAVSSISPVEVAGAIGAVAGAVVGAIVASVALRVTRPTAILGGVSL